MNRLLFEKTGNAVYISHLDLMRVFQRAFKRANIMIWHSQGFSPKAYVSIALPLSVGAQSQCEILDFEIEDGSVDINNLPEILNQTMPEGIRVLQAYESDRKIKNLFFLQAYLTLEYDQGVGDEALDAIKVLFDQPSILITKRSKKGDREVDIKPMIRSVEIHRLNEKELQLDVIVSAQNPGLNPQLLLTAIETYLPMHKSDFCQIRRMEVFDEKMRVFR